MRRSRTRFSKRRSKRKTEFPIVAVVQKKRKPEYLASSNPRFGAFARQGSNLETGTLAPTGRGTPSKFNTQKSGEQKETVLLDQNRDKNVPGEVVRDDKVATKSAQRLKKRAVSRPEKKSRASIDYKNVILLRNLITAESKILPRRINKLTAKQQRYVEKSIKSARIMGLVPFINKTRPFSNP